MANCIFRGCAPRRRAPRALVLALVLVLALPHVSHAAQVEQGATMTVLRGEVAVIRADGSAIQPAPSGLLVSPGDEIRTLTPAGALITFFVGTEIELGAGTILVVDEVSRDGDRINISLKQVLGVSVSRVQTLGGAGSSYQVDTGGSVALVRG
jgi:hypothetical protein